MRKNILKKVMMLILVMAMVLQPLAGAPSIYAGGGVANLGNIFTDVVLKIDDVEINDSSTIELEAESDLRIELKWALDDNVALADGDYATFEIPPQLKLIRDETGELKDDNDVVIATYALTKETNIAKITFNSELVNRVERSGDLWIDFEFDLDKFKDDSVQKIKFSTTLEKDYTITLKPLDGKIIDKEGLANADLNATKITWTIDVNTTLAEMENAVVNDLLIAGLTLDSVKVYNLTVGYEGDLTLGSEVSGHTSFPINLGNTNGAYRIVYVTSIIDNSVESFTNQATITGDGLSESDFATVETPAGSMIDKFDGETDNPANSKEVKWTIQVNAAQASLTDARVEDTIVPGTPGLALQAGSVKVYHLTINTDGTTTRGDVATLPTSPTYDVATGEMVISLGNINSAYEIEYKTDITYSTDDYGKNLTFNNTAKLYQTLEGESDSVEVDSDTGSATGKIKDFFAKSGDASITPGSKTIDWVIKVNEVGDKIRDVWVEDTSGDGIEYITDSLVVKDKDGNVVAPGTTYTLHVPGLVTPDGNGQEFQLIFPGTIDSLYTVEYSTKITDFNATNFDNSAQISWIPAGGGTGTTGGPGEVNRVYKYLDKVPVEATIENTFAKSSVGINYLAKTMDWQLNLGFYKGKTTGLVVTDTFPNNGLVFIEDTLVVTHKVGTTNTTLNKDDDYTVGKVENSYGKGFVINFSKEFTDSSLVITYKTSFDPDNAEFIANESSVHINEAEFTGISTYEEASSNFDQTREAKQTIRPRAFNNGQKEGTLDRENRKISWIIYTNFMEKDLEGSPFVVTDALSDGQSFDESTLVVRKYVIDETGNWTISTADTDVVDPDTYVLETDDGFTLTFTEGISERYAVMFDTKIEGISKDNYKNTAEVTGGNDLVATVDYPNHKDFLFKEATGVEENRVWLDDVINWELKINDSLSDIAAEAKIVDQISKGLIFVNGSVRIVDKDNVELSTEKYTVGTVTNVDESTELTITFLEAISEKYTVTYQTVVVAKTGTVKNNATFAGTEVVGNVNSEVEISVKQSSSGGSGGGIAKKGRIEIWKVDSKSAHNLITAEAEFEIYYLLNGVKRLVQDKSHKTVNGVITLDGLSFRTYYIKELTAPNGFAFDANAEPIEVVVNTAASTDLSGTYKFDVENTNLTTSFTAAKEWVGGTKPITEVGFQLYRNIEGGVKETVGDQVFLTGSTYTWNNLDTHDNDGNPYIFSFKESTVPANYVATYDGNTAVNTYTPVPDSIVLKAQKILQGQKLRAEQFEFELIDSAGEILQSKKNNANGQIVFDEIIYETSGEFSYEIREVKGTLGGVTYDSTIYPVTVDVTDDNGQLRATASYIDGPAEFNNTYTPSPGSIVLEAQKILQGQYLRANQFAFELLDENDDVLQTVKNNQHGQIIFNKVEFEKVGTYSFAIREVNEELGGVTYDQTIYPVTVVVTDDDEGQLHARISYDEGPAVFENIYTPTSDSIVLEARKILEGQELINNQFTFELLDESDQVIETATTNANGQIIFEELHYESAGKYTYIIRELEGVQGGMTYDDRQYTVVVTVVDDNEGQLIASANYLGGPAVFTNTYTPNPDSVVIEAYKILQGQNLRNGQFSFELVDAEGQVLQSKQNNANGQIIFDEITYDTLGEHAYTIREIKGSQGGVTYDETVFEVHVTVTDDREGNLTAVVEYPEEVEFNNTYVPAPDSVVFEAEKVLEGQDLRADQFDFELINSEGEVLQTKKNNANGQIIFDEITYDTQGEYSYSIREVKGSQGGVSYDGTVFKLAVTVIDNEEGNLIATVDYKTEQVVFTNSYAAAPTTATLVANKILEGKNLKSKQFSFELLDGDNKVLLTASNMADGSVKFPAIDYDQAGEYKYTIREVKADEPGYIYDDSEFEVIVTVTDDGEGKLHAKVVYTDGELPEFTNEFSQELLDSLYPEPPKTGESRSSSLLGLALIVAGLAVVVYVWQNQRPRKRYRGQ